ncbi:BON domain-containing protein [Rubripirellula reticaptiva]|uniref:Periplasmic protein n=1 Tax=Rubripirellula reticaptiva TaxID=2528013 RepID=A0A5C6F5F7_9BACT|nr:BON domain-containing protein [Rubripirellula reticaptiva]TWU56232.1 periplasmic protein [Rubripirellula reticaptiva]
MRRKYFGLAIAALATLGPMQAWGGDREIAEQIISRLKTNRDSGALKDFTLDMKVDDGVVLFRGSVSKAAQKDLVLDAADGIEGIAKIVDEVSVIAAQVAATETAEKASIVKPSTEVATAEEIELQQVPLELATEAQPASDFSFREALAAQARAIQPSSVMPGEIRPASAVEPLDDDAVVSSVVNALSQAKDAGQLKGFGVDVKSNNGVLQLTGRAASAEQRVEILRIAESVPGVSGIREAISVASTQPASLARLPQSGTPAQLASAPSYPQQQMAPQQAMTAPYRTQNGQPQQGQMRTVGMHGAPVMGQPVPMAPYSSGGGAPRYDSPNLPNYAWPGYAAHPNYAAVTYPQQYSPSAWPYIGPFYPYPQVPLGWRKVSLEWDDGWWFLDFTDR